ncbi:AAA family ATPase [Sulfitobacter sp. JBTF-M27]|uniref:AAA family ATPase n=1 Tax=Sulfitobacter sediminilitoris TaxID=2698830 RepID=A0A6P0CEU6_9RHOB|nr:ATP-binding protein [Sulfitobacter sediminilitoris]NEK23615.1 AAA family ATPase [Sulfitobacter sediminilitoris]
MVETAEYLNLRDALFMQAALMDDFLPRDLLKQVIPAEYAQDILLRAQLMSALREKCSTQGDMWQMRPIARRKLLSKQTSQDSLPDTEISAALKAESIYAPDALRKMVEDTAPIDTLSVAVATLEQAGPSAPGHAQLVALSSKLDKLRKEQATDTLLGDDFVGRDAEIRRLLDVLDNPERQAPLHALHIQGLPGVGKTFLLEELSRLCRERPRIVMVRLDFDRSSLSDGETEAVFDEISRQIGTAMPEVSAELHDLRLRTAERRTRIGVESTPSVPFDLLHRMIEILAERDRQLLLLLDTLEVLHGHGATFVNRLLSEIDRFADKERIDISVISAGRGPIFAQGDKRLRDLMLLEELDREVTVAILNKRNVPPELHARIIELSGGNPLRLILVARAVQEDGSNGVLGDVEIRDAGNGYLYRAILSRVPADIREIAAEGLILPEVGSWELRNIIGPALDINIDDERAAELLEMLEKQRWMIRQTGEDRFAHIDEVRREILELTYQESPDLTRRINERAAEMLADGDPVQALYHRLQLSRDGRSMPEIPPEYARRLTDALMEDLPPAAQDAVLRARGQRSRVDEGAEKSAPSAQRYDRVAVRKAGAAEIGAVLLRAVPDVGGGRLILVDHTGDAPPIDPGGLADLRNMLESRQGREATYILKQVMATPFRLEGEAGLLALTHQWQTGHWSMAKVLFDRLSDDTLDSAVQEDIGLSGLALLEMWAEFRFDELCNRLAEPHIFDATQHALSLTQRSGINVGALAFAHLVVAGSEMASEHGGVGMLSPYLSEQPTYMDRNMAERSHAQRAEFGLDFKADQADPRSLPPTGFAQVMAPLNPYAEPVRALLEDLMDDPDRKVLQDVAALGGNLTELASYFAPDVDGVAQAQERAGGAPLEANALLAATGLTAEFATGYSFVSPIPDLPTIARAAERWQQATLGNWQFGTHRPDGWTQTEFDPLVFERAQVLMRDPDPVRRAVRMIRIWDDPASDTGGSGSAILKRRLAKRYADISALKGLEARIAKLEKSGLPSVLQAPVAVLSEMGVPAKEIF